MVSPKELARIFPDFSEELVDILSRDAFFKSYPKGKVLYEEGFPCELVPFLLSGVVRVFKLGETGREVTLFRVGSGQTCVLSTSCSMSNAAYPAIAEVEEPMEMVAVPVRLFHELFQTRKDLQQFILRSYSDRLADMMLVVEEVAFRRVDLRLVEILLKQKTPLVEATHAQLAVELGTAREVISRILKDFERNGFLTLGRGKLEITNRQGLTNYHDKIQDSIH
ncbi:MAG: Crp/Fnr family transcriptional regulator [Deltaproteobacteria bacterium]|nr:Crp/Fnr family transcriptional regulator [Deltaproteobacteria bacterium]